MKPETFDNIVKKRAAERVEERVNVFKKKIGDAFAFLHSSLQPNYYNGWSHGGDGQKKVMMVMRSLLGEEGDGCGYPAVMWSDEEAAVEKELLATMDAMAQALIAKDIIKPSQIATEEPKP